MLIDSNIIIYAAQSEHVALRQFVAQHAPAVSAVSYVEVLGYHRLTDLERVCFEAFFNAVPILSLSQSVLKEAVKLRQIKKMTLGDYSLVGHRVDASARVRAGTGVTPTHLTM